MRNLDEGNESTVNLKVKMYINIDKASQTAKQVHFCHYLILKYTFKFRRYYLDQRGLGLVIY